MMMAGSSAAVSTVANCSDAVSIEAQNDLAPAWMVSRLATLFLASPEEWFLAKEFVEKACVDGRTDTKFDVGE